MGKRGFTLIELLVTVLIISILAAVAIPQYRRSVLKSKSAEALINLKPIAQAQKQYHLATGKYATEMEVLDVTPGKLNYFDRYIFHDEHVEVSGNYEGVEYWLTVFYNEVSSPYCGVVASQITVANPCEILSSDTNPRTDLYHGYLAYRL